MRNLVEYVRSVLPEQPHKLIFTDEGIAGLFLNGDTASVGRWSGATGWEYVTWPRPDAGCVGLNCVDDKCVAVFDNGDFIQIEDGEARLVGSLETEILACAWSPAGELACIVTGEEKILVLSTDFDMGDIVLGEHLLSSEDLHLAEKHVSVGWGKKETQFVGRGAKRAADPTVQLDIEERTSPDNKVEVSWRGDGEYFVVNSNAGERALRVFTSEGHLDSVSEPASNLSGIVAWEPRGGLIATVRGSDLQFFERNGLKRYTFGIEEGATQLAWSADSSVLAIVYATRIDLWMMKNWHWYRKQSVPLNGSLVWHSELPRTLAVAPTTEGIEFRTYRLTVSQHKGLLAVIDTDKVKVTPLDRCGMPPPMAYAEFECKQPVDVAVYGDLVAVATECCVYLLRLTTELEEIAKYDLTVRMLTFASQEKLLGYTGSSLVTIDNDAISTEDVTDVSVLQGEYYLRGSQLFCCQLVVCDFGEPCIDFVVGKQCFGLTRSQKLVCASKDNISNSTKVVANAVTSILGTAHHLLYTTLTSLRFVHLDQSVIGKLEGEQSREIERGSLVIAAMPDRMAVVLQAPRGNLETIYPRILVLGRVRACVAQLDYKGAFTTCRSHRINMNLLYDLDPAQFEAHASSVVAQLGTEIDLFLTTLENSDITTTIYVDSMGQVGEKEAVDTSNKVNHVLDLLRPHLAPQHVVSSWVLRQPPAYVKALRAAETSALIKHLLVLCDADILYRTALGEYEPRLALVVAQQAQMDPKEYVPFLKARDRELQARARFNIDVYLRNYELAIAHLIADEKALGTEISEFAIRHDLHELALQLLRSNPNEDRKECANTIVLSLAEQQLAESHYVDAGINFEFLGLHRRAFDAYVLGCAWRKAMCLAAPADLSLRDAAAKLVVTTEANKKYSDCATLHWRYLDDPLRAVELFCLGNDFDDAVLVAHTESISKEKLRALLRQSFGQFQELLADFAGQVPAQLKRLREVRAKRLDDMLGFESKLTNEVDGLAVDDTLSVAGSEATTGASVYTRYTDKSSTGTANTNATRRTLKNERRQERKKARGKKGSVYEEDYLIASSGRLIARLATTRADLAELVVALTRCDLVVYATRLTSEYNKVVAMLQENADEIYTIDDEARVRYDASGHEYMADPPQKPEIPAEF